MVDNILRKITVADRSCYNSNNIISIEDLVLEDINL